MNIKEELLSSIRTGNLSRAKDIIKSNVDINYRDNYKNTALYYAVVHCKAEIVRLLLDAEADITLSYEDNKNILHIAVESECEDKGVFEIIEYLLSAKVEINATDKYGNTPLWYACIYFAINNKTIRALLANGANMDLKNKFGTSAFESAQQNNLIPLLNILREFR